MAYQPVDWLAPLIERDIQAVISWHEQARSHPRVKPDPSISFQDDGSNFLSELHSPPLSDEHRVQIIRVLSTEDPLLLVSDGFTCIRARLASAALAALEAEIGEPIDLDTRGDVFGIQRCTVVTTPYGPPEGHVQLMIEEIKYHFHLRKTAGDTILIGERPEMTQLMNDLMHARNPDQVEDDGEQIRKGGPNGTLPGNRRSDQFETQVGPGSPISQVSIAPTSSPPVAPSQVLQTQPSARNKKAALSFSRDGVEVAVGVNLQRPTAAVPSRFAQRRSAMGPPKPAVISDSSANLLSVLGKRKANADDAIPASNDEEPPAQALEGQRVARQVASSETQPNRAQPGPESTKRRPEVTQARREASSAQVSQERTGKQYWRQKIPKNQRELLDSPSSWIPPLPGRQFPRPNVPMELLAQWNEQVQRKPESIVFSQSMPAQSQAARQSGDQGAAESADVSSEYSSGNDSAEEEELLPWSSSPTRPALRSYGMAEPVISPRDARQGKSSRTNHHSQFNSSPPEFSSGQPFLTSSLESPLRPPTAEERPDLPPDSSFERPVAPRALRQGQGTPARTRPAQNTRDFPLRLSPAKSASSVQASPSRSRRESLPHPLPPKPQWQPSPKGLFAPSGGPHLPNSQESGRIRSENALQYRSPPAQAWDETSREKDYPVNRGSSSTHSPPRAGMEAMVANHTGPPFRHVSESPARGQVARPASMSSATVIKGTQLKGRDEVDLTLDEPPRLDPAMEHRKRRSEYLQGEQRRRWIKANYTPDSKKPFNLGKLHSAYKKAHPKDQLRLSELAEAYHHVFPNASIETARDTSQVSVHDRPASAEPSKNVPSTVTRPQASRADVDDSDRTPSKVSSQPRKQERPELEGGSTALKSLNGLRCPEPTTQPAPANGIASDRRVPSPGNNDGKKGTQRNQIASQIPSTSSVHPSASSEAPPGHRKQRTAKAREADTRKSNATNRHIQAPQRPAKRSPASNAALDHRAWLIKRIERDQRRLQDEGTKGGLEEGEEGKDAFREFASAWGEMKPGGAFARPEGEGTGNKRGKRLDVLGWEL